MNLVAKLGYGIKCFCEQDLLDMDYNIKEVMIMSFKSCEFPMFSNLFQRDCSVVFCLRTSKRVSLGELIDHVFYSFLTLVYEYFKIYYYYIESIQSNYRFRYYMEENDVFGAIQRSFELRWKQEMVDSRSSISTDSHHQISINVKSLISIDYEAIRELMTNQKISSFTKSLNNYIISPWPSVRLFIRFLYCIRGRFAQRPFYTQFGGGKKPPLKDESLGLERYIIYCKTD